MTRMQARHGGHRAHVERLLAAERALDRGVELLVQGRSHYGALIGKGDRDYASTVDVAIEETIKRELARATPEVPFLGEEEGGAGMDAEQLWVLDPIDGTANFVKDSPLCGISLALVELGRPTLALIDLPFIGERYLAAEGVGAFLNGKRIAVHEVSGMHEAMIGFADFSVGQQPQEEHRVHLELMRRLAIDAERIRVHGSAALDLAWLAAGRLNATLMLSNLPWDVAAGVLLVREAGGRAYDVDGSDHSPRSRFTLASTPGLAEPIRRLVGDVTHG
jgi:myo-inositol-1(or 4)-monophosphatase